MKLDQSHPSLRDRLLGWTARLGHINRNASDAANVNAQTKNSPTRPELPNLKFPNPNRTTSQTILNAWASENRPRDSVNNSGSFLERLLGARDSERSVATTRLDNTTGVSGKQKEISRARDGLKQIDMSLQDRGRRIPHLDDLREKWPLHTPVKTDPGVGVNHRA